MMIRFDAIAGSMAALALVSSYPLGQARPAGDPTAGRGVLVGQVVDGATGAPIDGAIVVIFGDNIDWGVMIANANGQTVVNARATGVPEPAPPRQLIADALGRWTFRGLSKGRYTVHALAPGYLTGGYGQPFATSDGPLPILPNEQSIELEGEDDRIGGLTIRLWKPGVISGTVTDEAGEPVAGLAVRAWRRSIVNGQGQLVMVPGPGPINASTDDRGMYRISDLAPGEYVVGVLSATTTIPVDTVEQYFNQPIAEARNALAAELARSNAPAVTAGGYRVGDLIQQSHLSYPSTFHPAAALPSQAVAVDVASGEERPAVDLRLAHVPAVGVSGVVMGANGPIPNVGVQLCLADSTAFSRPPNPDIIAATASDKSGRFTFLSVTPGQYLVRVLQVPVWPRTAPGEVELPVEPTLWAATRVSVGTTDLRGVVVALESGAIVTGRLEFEGGRQKPSATELQRFTIQIGGGEQSPPAYPSVRIRGDGSFVSLGFPPGRYAIRADGRSAWQLRSATVRGRNVLDAGLDVGSEPISDLVLTFTDRPSQVSGRIRAADGTPAVATTVVVFPADADGWRVGFISPYRARMVRVTSAASYVVAAIPPGEYFIAALRADAVREWQDPGFLIKVAGVAARVNVANGERKTLDLEVRTLR